jgi:hypothetical protein
MRVDAKMGLNETIAFEEGVLLAGRNEPFFSCEEWFQPINIRNPEQPSGVHGR